MLFVVALAILLTWVVCALVLIGLGSLTLSSLANDFSLTSSFWVGLAVAAAFLEIWSLFLRVSLATSLAILLLGAIGLARHRAHFLPQLRQFARDHAGIVVSFFLIVFYVALRAAGPCAHYDTGLYGAQAVRWIETYPAVPGLANVHARLGFDSAVFLFSAALDQGYWHGFGFHLFTGLILAAMWTSLLPAWRLILGRAAEPSPSSADWFHALLIIPAAMWSARGQIVGTPTDIPANVVSLIAAGILFSWLERSHGSFEEGGRRNTDLLVAAGLFALAVSFKLSTVVFAALAWTLCAVCLFSWNPRAGAARKWALASLLLPAIIVLPWLARNLILSGYPFFPSTLLGIRADWRVPKSAANLIASWVHAWGRNPGATVAGTQGWHWFVPWLLRTVRMREQFQIPVLFSLGGIAAAWMARFRFREIFESCRWLWLLVPSFAGIAFWFIESPDTRFGAAAVWTAGATLGTLGIRSASAIWKRLQLGVFAAGILIALAWCLFSFYWQESYRPFLDVRGFIALPEARVVPRRTDSGLVVYVPGKGDQCWNSPIPCTPYFDPTLRLRVPGQLRDGFDSAGGAEFPPH